MECEEFILPDWSPPDRKSDHTVQSSEKIFVWMERCQEKNELISESKTTIFQMEAPAVWNALFDTRQIFWMCAWFEGVNVIVWVFSGILRERNKFFFPELSIEGPLQYLQQAQNMTVWSLTHDCAIGQIEGFLNLFCFFGHLNKQTIIFFIPQTFEERWYTNLDW